MNRSCTARLCHFTITVIIFVATIVAASVASAGEVLLVLPGQLPVKVDAEAGMTKELTGTVVAASRDDLFAARKRLRELGNTLALVVLAASLRPDGVSTLDEPVGNLRVFWSLPHTPEEYANVYGDPPTGEQLKTLAEVDLLSAGHCNDEARRSVVKSTPFDNLRGSTHGAVSDRLKAAAKRRPKGTHDMLIAHFDGEFFRFHDGSRLRPKDLGAGTWLAGCSTAGCRIGKGATVGTTRPLTSTEAFKLASTVRDAYLYDGGTTLRSVMQKVSLKHGFVVALVGVAILVVVIDDSDDKGA